MSGQRFRANRTFEQVASRDPVTRRPTYENRDYLIELEIDWDALFTFLGRKAAHNKSGVAKIQGGMIKARAKRQIRS